MTEESDGGEAGRAILDPHRLEAFSDGVLAVIITIMALGLKVPSAPTWSAVARNLPQLLAFALSFVFVAIYWNNHHHLLRATRNISGGVMWANMALLFWLALIPVLTAWVASAPSAALPAAFYGMDAAASAIAYGVLVRVIIAANGRTSAIATAIGSDLKGNASIVGYLLATGLAFVSPFISYGIYVAVAVVWIVPDRRLSGRSGPAGAS
ncbi:MAG: TMEM175 family protein [Streptosporangiaceae bacterium]